LLYYLPVARKKLSKSFYKRIGAAGGKRTVALHGKKHFARAASKRKTFGAGPGRGHKSAAV
jgi:hypothetical protein